MKKIILLAFTALIMVGCISDEKEAKIYESEGFATLTYDGCEYVFKTAGYKGFLAHKGNCKFCAERRKKELDSLAIKIWEGFE